MYLFPSEYGPACPPLKGRDLVRELAAECRALFSVGFKGIRASQLTARSLIGKRVTLRRGSRGWLLEHPGMSEYDVVVLRER